jgi:tRNA(adenine34) deaminase
MKPLKSNDEYWMKQALSLAHYAQSQNEVPVGAVITLEDRKIGEGWNQPITSLDPCAHAEIIALRKAALQQKNYRLLNSTLYVTLEPCIMCLGAIIHARVQRLVFAAKDPKAGAICSAFSVLEEKKFNHLLKWNYFEEMSEDCGKILSNFFHNKRKKSSSVKKHIENHKILTDN